MNKKLILNLTEIARKGDDLEEKPLLLNADYVVMAQHSEVQRHSKLDIGASDNFFPVTSVMLAGGRVVFVKEDVAAVTAKIAEAQA